MRRTVKISNLKILLPYLKPYRLPKMLFIIILMILGAICSIYPPMVTRKIIDVHIVALDFLCTTHRAYCRRSFRSH